MPDPTLTFGAAATLGVAASLMLATPPASALAPPAAPPVDLAAFRARGQAGLDDLLARYHAAEQAPGFDAATWERALDTVAAQRYASHAGLYWYTELDAAEAEAHRSHRPILSLRMLGDLRDDLSCANSRLFRTTLYANRELAAFLRSTFVLYWSSERAVPRITIDYGDGRKIATTITGNSAHYVLDEDGHVLDVLPGLYAPRVFQAELAKTAGLAARVRGTTDAVRAALVTAFHEQGLAEAQRAWEGARGLDYFHGWHRLFDGSAAAIAERATVSKAIVEIPQLRSLGMIALEDLPDDQTGAWATIGQKLWDIHASGPRASSVLDDASLALVRQLAGPRPSREFGGSMLERLDQHIVADTALNQLKLRTAIRGQLVQRPNDDFATLNAWIYTNVFLTPASDPWLGLLPRTDFTGLPGDGVVEP